MEVTLQPTHPSLITQAESPVRQLRGLNFEPPLEREGYYQWANAQDKLELFIVDIILVE